MTWLLNNMLAFKDMNVKGSYIEMKGHAFAAALAYVLNLFSSPVHKTID